MVEIKNAITEKGNLKSQVHQNIKAQVGELIGDTLGFDITPSKNYAKQVAVADGKPVYVRVDFVVTLADPFVEKTPTKKESNKPAVIEVPELF